MTITKLDKTNIKGVRDSIQKKLDELKDLGLDIQLKSIRYEDYKLTSRIEVKVNSPEATKVITDKKVSADNANLQAVGLYVGYKFRVDGDDYTVTGWNSRARKYPVKAENALGKSYKFPVYHSSFQVKQESTIITAETQAMVEKIDNAA